MDRRSSDEHLDEEIVSGLLAVQFPDLAGHPVTRFGAGWDHELFRAGEWIFRFPRRAERARWLVREIEISAVTAQTLGPVVPVFERLGRPSAAFPYPFTGYRWLPGVAADQAPIRDPHGLAADVGALLSRLHAIDPCRVPPTPEGWEDQPWSQLRHELAGLSAVVRPLLGPRLRSMAEPYLAGRVREPPQDGPRRFIHNDICPGHLLVDPGTGRLTGLIDFTDAMAGDPALDFAGLIGVGGRRFLDDVIAHYSMPLGDGFDARLGWLTRALTLSWLADAAVHDPASVSTHLSWVDRAFRDWK